MPFGIFDVNFLGVRARARQWNHDRRKRKEEKNRAEKINKYSFLFCIIRLKMHRFSHVLLCVRSRHVWKSININGLATSAMPYLSASLTRATLPTRNDGTDPGYSRFLCFQISKSKNYPFVYIVRSLAIAIKSPKLEEIFWNLWTLGPLFQHSYSS